MLRKSWDDVSEQTIVNCFRKAGISPEHQNDAQDESDDPFSSLDDDSLADLDFNLEQLKQISPESVPAEIDASDLIEVDNDVATNCSQPLSVEEIVSDLTQPDTDVPLEDNTDQVTEDCDAPPTYPSRNDIEEALEVFSTLSLFCKDTEFHPLLSNLERKIKLSQQQRLTQSTLDNFLE